MLIDCGEPSSLRAWVEVCPSRHAPQLEGLALLPLWGRYRETIAAALSPYASPGLPPSSPPTPGRTT
jgi:hypothetical protein